MGRTCKGSPRFHFIVFNLESVPDAHIPAGDRQTSSRILVTVRLVKGRKDRSLQGPKKFGLFCPPSGIDPTQANLCQQ